MLEAREPDNEIVLSMDKYMEDSDNDIMLSMDKEWMNDFHKQQSKNEVLQDVSHFHWMRAGKSGTTSLCNFLTQKQKHGQCSSIKLHFHDVGSSNLNSSAKSFMVLRNPVERFVSFWNHMKVRLNTLHYSFDIHYTKESMFESPLTLARALNESTGTHDFFIKPHAKPGVNEWIHVIVTWPYKFYANENTQFACLPNLWTDLAKILDKEVPGCRIDDYKLHANAHSGSQNDYDHSWVENDELQNLVTKLYSEDVALWKTHC